MVDEVKVDTGKFSQAEKAYRDAKAKFDTEEVKASSWIARHPGWTLAIGIAQLIVIAWLSLRHL